MKKSIHSIQFEVVQGDITAQSDMQAVVNAANARLLPGGGVAGAIHRVAGPELVQACLPLAPISPGEAVITPGFWLPNDYVIHCLGPVYGRDKPADVLLAACYRSAIRLAEENQIESLAFPAISTGIFGYPITEAAPVAWHAVIEAASGSRHVKRIRMVLFNEDDRQVYEAALAGIE